LLIVLHGLRVVCLVQAGRIASLVNRVDQSGRVDVAQQFNVGPLVGQVDADTLDPGDFG
jgi:hypothetical protein